MMILMIFLGLNGVFAPIHRLESFMHLFTGYDILDIEGLSICVPSQRTGTYLVYSLRNPMMNFESSSLC
jgi:hypothetical protein